MIQNEFEILISDTTKRIVGDISWGDDEDHSPSLDFCVEVESDAGYANRLGRKLTMVKNAKPASSPVAQAAEVGGRHLSHAWVGVLQGNARLAVKGGRDHGQSGNTTGARSVARG